MYEAVVSIEKIAYVRVRIYAFAFFRLS